MTASISLTPRVVAFLASFSSITSCSASSSSLLSPDSLLTRWYCSMLPMRMVGIMRGIVLWVLSLRWVLQWAEAFLKTRQDGDISIFIVAR